MANVYSYGNNLYSSLLGGNLAVGRPNIYANLPQSTVDSFVKNKLFTPIGNINQQQQTSSLINTGSQPGKVPAALGDYMNRISLNASDALYGGLLGYQQKPITSPTGNQYQPPTNQGFQFPFGLLNRNFLGG